MKPPASNPTTLRFFYGMHFSKPLQALQVRLDRPPKALVKAGQPPTFYNGASSRIERIGMISRNATRACHPVFPLSRLYTLEGANRMQYHHLLRKLILKPTPLLFYDDAPLVCNRVYIQHLAEATRVPLDRVINHLSGSLQYLGTIDHRYFNHLKTRALYRFKRR